MTEKEETLIAGCLRSEKAAWDSFVLQYSNLVYHTIKKTLNLHHAERRADLVEDLYQEFFLSLLRNDYKKLRQFRGAHGCSLASWLRLLAARLTSYESRLRPRAKLQALCLDTAPTLPNCLSTKSRRGCSTGLSRLSRLATAFFLISATAKRWLPRKSRGCSRPPSMPSMLRRAAY